VTNASQKYLIDILPHALYLRAQVAISQTRWDNAERDLERLMNGDSKSPISLPAEFLRADVAYRRGEYAQAKDRFAALAGKLGGRNDRWIPMVPLRRAQVLAQQQEWAEARVLAEQIAKDYPNFDQQYEADYLIGRCHAADAKLQEARQAYQKVLRSPNGSKTETAAMAQWMIGETFFLQEHYEAAIREYLRVEVLYAYPHWQAGGLLQAGKCYEQLGQWKEAGDVYARLLKLYPQASGYHPGKPTRKRGPL
jgi:TolA-binding protein